VRRRPHKSQAARRHVPSVGEGYYPTNSVDANADNFLLGAIKCAISDYSGMYLTAGLSDVLFGKLQPITARPASPRR
jgi:hypothetical protein